MAIRVKPFRTKVVFNINYHKFSKIQGYVEETNECVLLDKEMNIINPNYCINDNV